MITLNIVVSGGEAFVRSDSSIVESICCPLCRTPVSLNAHETDSDGHVITGTLTCAACATSYPIARGIPRLIAGSADDRVTRTVEAFGFQWQRANPLIRNARISSPELFLDFVHPIGAAAFAGKVVLDAGCGMGRFTLNAQKFGARLVIGVDLSDSVEAAFENTRHLGNVVIVQADIFHLPVARVVGHAFSIGVLHHTPDPRAAFLSVVSTVVPGGRVSAWVYGREGNGWIIHLLDPIRRVTSRLPRRVLLAAAHVVAVPLVLITKGVYGTVARSRRLRPLRAVLFYFDYLAFLSQFGYREQAYVVFDHAVPVIAKYIPRQEFEEWFVAAGLKDVVITRRGGNSWRGSATVPPLPSAR
jgi:SAM-dependent methyltransferase